MNRKQSYNNAIKFFKEQNEHGAYVKIPMVKMERNLAALTDFAKELNKLQKQGYSFEYTKALEIPKTLYLEAPLKPFTTEVPEKQPENLVDIYEKYKKLLEQLKILPQKIKDNMIESTVFDQELLTSKNKKFSFTENIYKFFVELVACIIQINRILKTNKKEIIKNQIENFIPDSLGTFITIINGFELLHIQLSHYNQTALIEQKKQQIDILFFYFIQKVIGSFINSMDVRSIKKIITNLTQLRDSLEKYNNDLQSKEVTIPLISGPSYYSTFVSFTTKLPKRKTLTSHQIQEISSVIFDISTLIDKSNYLSMLQESKKAALNDQRLLLAKKFEKLPDNVIDKGNIKKHLEEAVEKTRIEIENATSMKLVNKAYDLFVKDVVEPIEEKIEPYEKKGFFGQIQQYAFGTKKEQRLKEAFNKELEKVKKETNNLKRIYFILPPGIETEYLKKNYKKKIEGIQYIIKNYMKARQEILDMIRRLSPLEEGSIDALIEIQQKKLNPLINEYKKMLDKLKESPLLGIITQDEYQITFTVHKNLKEKLIQQTEKNK